MEIKEAQPPYVRFERRPVEDRPASMREGRYMTKDLDFAIVTPIGSKDMIPRVATEWLAYLEQQVKEGRFNAKWLDEYRAAYKAWQAGEEMPISGTPIKGWPLLSPAQQANVISANILRVEDLAGINDEAIRRIGPGALEMKEKAVAWLKAAKGSGVAAQEVADLTAKARQLQAQIESQQQMLRELRAENELLAKGAKSK
jgi:hypothetical protein